METLACGDDSERSEGAWHGDRASRQPLSTDKFEADRVQTLEREKEKRGSNMQAPEVRVLLPLLPRPDVLPVASCSSRIGLNSHTRRRR